MTLNKQLLCVSLVLLCLPWAGCQYLREMEQIMRDGQQQTLMATTKTMAAVLSTQADLLYPHGIRYGYGENQNETAESLYFSPSPAAQWIDGYSDNWETIPEVDYYNPTNGDEGISLRTAIYGDQLFLFFDIKDDQVIFNNPTNSLMDDGDRIVLVTGNATYRFTTSAPGKVTARYVNGSLGIYRESTIAAYWQDTNDGFSLEIQLPYELANKRLGFYFVDQDQEPDHQTSQSYGNIDRESDTPPPFIYQPEALKQQLDVFEQPGLRFSIVDPYYWLLATSGQLIEHTQDSKSHWVIRRLYRFILNSQSDSMPIFTDQNASRQEVINAFNGDSKSAWYKDSSQPNFHVISSAVPIIEGDDIVGVLVAEQSSAQLTALADSAFSRLLVISFAAIFAVGLGLLGYASWLSWRIKHLSQAANHVMSPDGKILDNFPTSQARDEIGELTRNYGLLLKQIGEYTDYLQTLSRKLSHELRTPLAIIHSSLDNLGNQSIDEKSRLYHQRAKEGTLRLGNIITAMSEASRVEESISNSEPEQIHIVDLLTGLVHAYQDIYTQQEIRLLHPNDIDNDSKQVLAVADLLIQMLDKLIDNAVSFCPTGGLIELAYELNAYTLIIRVANEGPLLPETMRNQLFDNMVSLRTAQKENTHLGLGLHIVKLIVQSHQGQIRAENKPDNSGVVFTVEIPR